MGKTKFVIADYLLKYGWIAFSFITLALLVYITSANSDKTDELIAFLDDYCQSIGFNEIYQTGTCIKYEGDHVIIQKIHCKYKDTYTIEKCWTVKET